MSGFSLESLRVRHPQSRSFPANLHDASDLHLVHTHRVTGHIGKITKTS